MKKIGIFGGAFNPPTLGHQFVIEQIIQSRKIDELFIILDGKRDDKNYGIPEEKRKQLFDIFITELQKKHHHIKTDFYFFEQSQMTLTLEVDVYFRKKFPHDSIVHIFGADVVKSIASWSGNPEKYIEKKIKKIFVYRTGYFIDKKDLDKMENYTLLEVNGPQISSSLVREKIQKKEDISSLVCSGIGEFIAKHQLYQ